MSLQSIARSAFASIKIRIPESVTAVVSNGQTAQGVKDTLRGSGSLDAAGEMGTVGGTVRVDASEITEPELGSSILVGGHKAIVVNVRTDSAGALLAIEYQETTEA
jgi:hypothetical protein